MIPQLSFYQYRPTYQGIPLEEAKYALEKGAEAYDTNLENFNKLEAFGASIRALPQDSEYVKQKLAGTQEAIKNIADQTTGTKRWDLAGDAIQRMKSSFQGDAKLGAIRESYLNFAEGEKLKQEMRSKGMTPFETTDINSHKSFDDEGNINIFRPVIEPKADYVKEANSIWNEIDPDIVSANLQPSEVAGILEGKTIKGISPEKLRGQLGNVYKTYMETDSGQQHVRFLNKNSPEKEPTKFIQDFLLGVGSLRSFRQEGVERMPDPSYQWEQRALLAQQQAAYKLALKKATGRGNYEDGNEKLFRVESLKTKGEVGQQMIKGNALMINNPVIIEGFSKAQFTGDGSRIVPLNKNQKFDWQKDQITDIKVKGFALDTFEGEDTLGGMIGEAVVTDDDGKKSNVNVLIKNTDPEFKKVFNTYHDISNKLSQKNKGNNEIVPDSSGLFDFTNQQIYLKVTKDNKIIPVGKLKDGKYGYFTDQERDALGLKENYDTKDFQNLMIDKIAPKLLPYTETAAQLNK